MSRLPMPGGDQNQWGAILNDFLNQAHAPDGTLKPASITAAHLRVATPVDGHALVANSQAPGGFAWSPLSGTAASIVTLSGDVIGPSNANHIADGAVTTNKLADGAVTNVKISDGAITSTKIANYAITSNHLAGGVINETNLSTTITNKINNPVASIADGSIGAIKLNTPPGATNGQVLTYDASTGGGYKWSTLTAGSATPMGPASGDLTGSYPSPTIAAGVVTNGKLADNSVTSAKIVDGTIQETDLASGLLAKINSPVIPNNTITPGQLNDGNTTPNNGDYLVYNSTTQNFQWVTAPRGTTNLTSSATATTVTVLSDTGNDATVPAATAALAGVMSAADKAKLDGISGTGTSVTNLSATTTPTSVTVVSDTGADATLAAATTSVAGVMSAADKSKLDGVVAGATVNQTDAYLLNRANHTGTQAISTITNLQTTLDAKADLAYTINSQTGTAYTLVGTDAGKFLTLTNASPITLTVPANASVAFPVGTRVYMAQLGTGQVTVSGAAGVTVNAAPGRNIAAQFGGAELVKLATDTWLLVGHLS